MLLPFRPSFSLLYDCTAQDNRKAASSTFALSLQVLRISVGSSMDTSTSGFLHVIFLLIFSCYCFQFCCPVSDTISAEQPIGIEETIVSASQIFELGFFKSSTGFYVGIWYKKVSTRTIVWVANRDNAITSSSPVLKINNGGNLVIASGKFDYKVSDLSSTANTAAVLQDSGNLVLKDVSSNTSLWQSFDFPTDTFLPGMKLGYDKRKGRNWSFVSWRSPSDPSSGAFSLALDPNGTSQIFLMRDSTTYWKSEPFLSSPEIRLSYIFNFSSVYNENEGYFTYDVYNRSTFSRFIMDVGGQFQQLSYLGTSQQWSLFWAQPRTSQCEFDNYCGAFAYCDSRERAICTCLWGFEPNSSNNWDMRFYAEGCKRKISLQCSNSSAANSTQDKFTTIRNLALPKDSVTLVGQSFDECRSACLNDCSCTAFAYSINCSLWKGDVINLRVLNNSSGRVLFYKLAASEFVTGKGNKRKLWIITASAICAVIAASAVFLCLMRKKKLGQKEAGEDLLSFDFSISPGATKYELSEEKNPAEGRKEVDVPLFRFSSILAATDDFSPANKLGEGGFGPVYKGKVLNGHEIAVKRLSRRSGQGLEELKNEAMLIAKLQHKNLVKLLGWCIEGDEKILIYEYLPNKSLDHFLFGPTKHGMLDWGMRVHIIEGIAQGLLYLHQFSRLQIIHRDLKASNILLDIDMNPKISDFGMARIFGGKESQATNRIVGTYGYMSPEYALEGIFSVKSDVFSFGVLLLEILSGKKNTGFYNTSSLNLLGYAWDMWRSGKAMELMDPTLEDVSASENRVLRFIKIGLLCVQESPSDRPTMSDIVSALGNEAAVLPSPKQPAFSNVRSKMDKHWPTINPENCSVNNLTVSILESR